MNNSVDKNTYIKATKEGKLYIKTSDFFKQAKVKTLLNQLSESSIFKKIEGDKTLAQAGSTKK